MGIQITNEFSHARRVGSAKLIIGVGNIGPKYVMTRHNAGFLAVDGYRNSTDLPEFSEKGDLHALVSEGLVDGQKVILAKPTTMVNLSGRAVQALQSYYDVANSDTLVIYDDVDLQFGKLRVRFDGSSGGHNGIKSISHVLGDDYPRLRVGILNELNEKMETHAFVLANFSKEEQERLDEVFECTNEFISYFLEDSLEAHTKDLNK